MQGITEMLVKCVKCKRIVDAYVEQQQCTCGMYYGLTPYFSATKESDYHVEKKK